MGASISRSGGRVGGQLAAGDGGLHGVDGLQRELAQRHFVPARFLILFQAESFLQRIDELLDEKFGARVKTPRQIKT